MTDRSAAEALSTELKQVLGAVSRWDKAWHAVSDAVNSDDPGRNSREAHDRANRDFKRAEEGLHKVGFYADPILARLDRERAAALPTGVWSTSGAGGPSPETVEYSRPILEAALAEGRTNVVISGYPWSFQFTEAVRSPADAALATSDELDGERLWKVLEGMGIIASGTWVGFQREDAEHIAREYAALRSTPEAGS